MYHSFRFSQFQNAFHKSYVTVFYFFRENYQMWLIIFVENNFNWFLFPKTPNKSGKQMRQIKQEYIPVECVPPAAVAVGEGVSSWLHAGIPLGMGLENPPPGQTPQLPPWVWAWRPTRHAGIPPPRRPAARHAGIPPAAHAGIPPPPVNRMTDRHM